MGCANSLFLNADDGLNEDDDQRAADSVFKESCGKESCGFSETKSNFDLSQMHPLQPPFLGSAYELEAKPPAGRTPPPALVHLSPLADDATCSTGDDTPVMANLQSEQTSFDDSLAPRRLFDDSLSIKSEDFRQEQSVIIHQGVLVRGKVESPERRTSRLEQEMTDTLPSTTPGQPIRLKVVEDYSQGDDNGGDDCSYDPYFSMGKYHITTCNGSPYGNSLSVKMTPQNMTLEEGNGRIVAIMRSLYTYEPSQIIYSQKRRYENQLPSNAFADAQHKWYPWALVKKDGPSIYNDASVYLHHPGGWGEPVWKCRHGFVGSQQSHTVVTRVVSETNEIPCCLVLRDPVNRDVFSVTIAPGIDPILTICYLAVHSKMDVEPLMLAVER